MDNYIISGIQHVGIGVEDLRTAWRHYIRLFKMDVRILEDNSVAELMSPYTGYNPQKRHAAIAINMQGGGGFELLQYTDRTPQKPNFDIKVGDLGVFATKIKSRNVNLAYDILEKYSYVQMLSKPQKSIDGYSSFFMKDKFANAFNIINEDYVFIDENRCTGGVVGTIIGVSNIEESLRLYRDILGYDKVVFEGEGVFDDFKGLPGGDCNFKRILLTHSTKRKGAFSELFGQSYIELVQVLDRKPEKIYKDRLWGDPGFIHLCFDIHNMNSLRKKCESLGFPFTVDSRKDNQDETVYMDDASGAIAFVEDPDGTLIGFIETHKIPVIKKLGINIKVSKNYPEKPLNKFMLKGLRLGRVSLKSLR